MKQQVVYLSGGTSGINLGIAKGFAARGARVLAFGRDPTKAQAAADEVRAAAPGAQVMAGGADVRNYCWSGQDASNVVILIRY